MTLPVTRRDFVNLVGRAGGAAAVYGTLDAMGLLGPPEAADHQIYGGITWTGRDITQLWYPSHAFHAAKGIVIGAYIWTSEIGERFAELTPPERYAAGITDGVRIHGGYAGLVKRGVPVARSKIPFSRGAYIQWSEDATAARDALPILAGSDGPFYLAGKHVSHIPGWIEGAVRSAQGSVAQIAARAAASSTQQ